MNSRRVIPPALLFMTLVSSVAVLFLGTPAAGAQAPKVFKIGILTSAWSPWHSNTKGFRDALKALGYAEGKNVTFETRAAGGDPTRLPKLAGELVRQRPDLLYCVATPDAQACQKATQTIPIVFTQVNDPVKLGLVESLARPGGNITGIGSLRAELVAKRLELFKETVPSLRRVLVTYDPRELEERKAVMFARSVATHLGLTLLERPITARLAIEPGLAELKEGGQDGILIVQPSPNLNIPGRSMEVPPPKSSPPCIQPHSGRNAARWLPTVQTSIIRGGRPPGSLTRFWRERLLGRSLWSSRWRLSLSSTSRPQRRSA